MESSKSKIFGIGLSKTGTTSLANALQILGYRTKDNMGVVAFAPGDLRSVDLDVVDAHDALTDTPIPSFYRELDARYPGSKFILTVREKDGWLQSCKKQFNQRFTELQSGAVRQLFVAMYGTDAFDAERFVSGYEQFVAGVLEYFRHRPRDLLVMDIAAGDGWERLCPFLGRAVPDLPFPKANVTQVRWMNLDDVVAVARQAGGELIQHYGGERQSSSRAGDEQGRHAAGAKRLLQRTVRTMLGRDVGQSAAQAANRVIVAGLKKLAPQIPVLSRLDDPVPFAERKHWNHLWLVDPLDGEAAFVGGSGDFSVNIALVEDGRPVYGVVHVLPADTTYYGRMGKGAYRQIHGREPTSLASESALEKTTAKPAQPPAVGLPPPGVGPPAYAPAMCALSERMGNRECALPPSSEWQTAAAQVILSCIGMRVCAPESGQELVYNKSDLTNDGVSVRRVS